MVTKKAIHLIDLLLQGDIKLRDGMLDPSKSWNFDNDQIHSLVQTHVGLLDQNIKILETLQKELKINCQHPKILQDKDPSGQEYCLSCNQDM